MYMHTLPCKVTKVKILTNRSEISLLLAKTCALRWKLFSLCCKHITCLHCYYEHSVFTIYFNTHCQMVMPLTYCTCMRVWSAVIPSINCLKYCVYYISNVSLTKKTDRIATSTTYLRLISVFILDIEWVLAESDVKLQYFVTIMSLIIVSSIR